MRLACPFNQEDQVPRPLTAKKLEMAALNDQNTDEKIVQATQTTPSSDPQGLTDQTRYVKKSKIIMVSRTELCI